MPDLTTAYELACSTPSDINEHLPTMAAIVHELQATKVIELGTRGGVSTIAWLHALEQTGGRLWSVDIDPRPNLERGHWTFIQGDDCADTVIDQLPNPVDVVFIDTSHGYQHTLNELCIYRPFVRPGGRIVLHDTELHVPGGFVAPQPPYPVKKAVIEFCEANNLEWQNYPHNNGLGVIHV